MTVLIEKVSEIAGEGNIVMTGDFNAYEDSSVYAVARESFNDTKYIAENSDEGPTFTKYGTKEDNGRGAIDFIFVSEGITAENYKIIRNTVKGIYPSDHFPIVADINLK
mgnify:CR=1 FL=1